jgi:hypothetical protein
MIAAALRQIFQATSAQEARHLCREVIVRLEQASRSLSDPGVLVERCVRLRSPPAWASPDGQSGASGATP